MGKEFQNNYPASHRIMSNLIDGLNARKNISTMICLCIGLQNEIKDISARKNYFRTVGCS